jgi:hypothetical protein
MGTERGTVSRETKGTKVSTIRIATVKRFADGMTNTGAIFRPDLPKEISCRLDWKNNLCGAARSRLGSRNGCSPALRTLSGGYLRHLRIAHTS